jgi:predicted dehydrogenase
MGYDDLKVIEAYRFVRSIAEGKPAGTTLDDAVAAARVLDAMTASVQRRGWVGLTKADISM